MDPFCYLCFVFVLVINVVLSVPCSLGITCWERAALLAPLCVMFSCVIVSFPNVALGKMWYLIELIPDLCLLFYFYIEYMPSYSLTLYILMDFPIHMDTISMGLPIVYFKGS